MWFISFLLLPICLFSNIDYFEGHEKTLVPFWVFEDLCYIELDGHLYVFFIPKHSANCPCYDEF